MLPTQESFGSPAPVAQMLSDNGFRFLHYTRYGRWVVPLPQRSGGWLVAQLDYWAMAWANTTLPAAATSVTVECAALPCNVMIFAQ